MSKPQTHSAYRATIIVDSSAFIDLSKSVPMTFASNSVTGPKTMLGLLKLLADHGFEIVIPESVAMETAEILTTRQKLRDVFPYSRLKPFHLTCEAFIEEILQKNMPGIHIVSSHEPRAAEYIGEIKRILTTTSSQSEKAHAVEELRKTHNKEQMGDDDIVHMMHHAYSAREQQHPVFVLATDAGLLDRLPQERRLGLGQLLYELFDSGLQRELGLNETVTAPQLETLMLKKKNKDFTADSGDNEKIKQFMSHPFNVVFAHAIAESPLPPATRKNRGFVNLRDLQRLSIPSSRTHS